MATHPIPNIPIQVPLPPKPSMTHVHRFVPGHLVEDHLMMSFPMNGEFGTEFVRLCQKYNRSVNGMMTSMMTAFRLFDAAKENRDRVFLRSSNPNIIDREILFLN